MDSPTISFAYHCTYGMWARGKGHVFECQSVYIQFNKVDPSHGEGVASLSMKQ